MATNDKFKNIDLEDMSTEDIYELEEIHSPLVSSEPLEKDKLLLNNRKESKVKLTDNELNDMLMQN